MTTQAQKVSPMKAAVAATVLVVALLAGAGTEPAAASHLKQKCFPRGSKTVYKTSEGRFYTRTTRAPFGGSYKALYACSYRYGRSYRLWEGAIKRLGPTPCSGYPATSRATSSIRAVPLTTPAASTAV